MGFQVVYVWAYVPEAQQPPQPPLGIWGPTDPRPGWGLPEQPPGIWGGGNVPMPSPPIANVPGAPGYQPPLGIWGPTDPRPGWGLPEPQPPTGAHPEHPIYYPPGIWGPTDPRPGWGLPGPQPPPGVPTHPIYYPPGIWGPTDPRPGWGLPEPQPPQQPPGIWGGGNEPFPTPPISGIPGLPGYEPPPDLPPVIDIGDLPEHPEVPDLNAGNWMRVRSATQTKVAFVPWPLAVTHPDYNPNYPVNGLPGEWVMIFYQSRLAWAWVPTVEDSGGEGEQG